MSRLLSLMVSGLLAGTVLAGCAQASPAARLADVTVVNRDTGERLRPYRHQGRLYVVGTPGQRYAIEVRNRDSRRVLSVLSVDGVNVLTGETAAPDQSGYVLSPGQRYSITGWRKSMEEVAQFYFTALPDSYAARTDRPDHVGVIGVALFSERPEPPPVLLREQRVLPQSPAPAESAAASPSVRSGRADSPLADSFAEAESGIAARQKAERLGTGHGAREASRTRYTNFERAAERPEQIVTIYYDSRENLVALGVIPSPRPLPPAPNPFPAQGFVPDPRS